MAEEQEHQIQEQEVTPEDMGEVEGNPNQEENRKMTPWEQNWILYLYAGIPWWEAKKITDEEEREFLISRCYDMKMMREEHEKKEAEKEQATAQQGANLEEHLAGLTSGLAGTAEQLAAKTDGQAPQ